MNLFNKVNLIYQQGEILDMFFIFYFLLFTIISFFTLLTLIICSIKKSYRKYVLDIIWYLLASFTMCAITHLLLENVYNDLNNQNEKRNIQEHVNKKITEFDKMCFTLDTTITADLSDYNIKNENIYNLLQIINNYYDEVLELKNEHYNDYKTANGFDDNELFSSIYSLGYKNMSEIKKEIHNREIYCFKNYCSDAYYNLKIFNNINNTIQHYNSLNCDELFKNKGIKN